MLNITSFQILLQFITSNGGSKVATALNFHNSTGQLTASQRRVILHGVIDYVVKEYGYYPSQDAKKEIANVVVTLFPCLGKKHGDKVIVSDLFLSLIFVCSLHLILY